MYLISNPSAENKKHSYEHNKEIDSVSEHGRQPPLNTKTSLVTNRAKDEVIYRLNTTFNDNEENIK